MAKEIEVLDLNTVSAQELVQSGLGDMDWERAHALVEFREENGPFESWESVKAVPGWSGGLIVDLQQAGVVLGGTRETRAQEGRSGAAEEGETESEITDE